MTDMIDDAIAAFVAETDAVSPWSLKPKDYATARAVLDSAPDAQAAVLVRLCEQMTAETGHRARDRQKELASALFARALPVTAPDLERMMAAAHPHNEVGYYIRLQLWGGLVRVTRRFLDTGGALTPLMRGELEAARIALMSRGSKDFAKTAGAVSELLGDSEFGLPDPGERWADAALAQAQASPPWAALLTHALSADSAKPSAKWLAEAARNRRAVGEAAFRGCITDWLRQTQIPPPRGEVVYSGTGLARVSEKNIGILKGLAWYSSTNDSPDLAWAMGHTAEAAFQNILEYGVWAKSAGNAAIWSLGQMPGGVGVGPLARLRTRLRDRGALKLIAASIEAAAKSAGMTVDELEDLAVPTGGLGADGTRRETFGEAGGEAVAPVGG